MSESLLRRLREIDPTTVDAEGRTMLDRLVREVAAMTYPVSTIARMCHEANRIYCDTTPAAFVRQSVAWEYLDAHTRESVVAGVLAIILRRTKSPEEQHEEWCSFKRKNGWTHGEKFDEAIKQHPCLLPYAELSEAHKRKDLIFRSIVQSMIDPVL